MNKIIVMIGVSGSGKSMKAVEFQTANPHSVIIGRDKLREMLFGYNEKNIDRYYLLPDLYLKEQQISKYQDLLVKEALKEGKLVILDNTHLKLRYINEIKKKYSDCEIEFCLIEADIKTALENQVWRTRKVNLDVIREQLESLKQLKKVFDFKTVMPIMAEPIIQDTSLPQAFIFDIDGTLSLHGPAGRSPYDYSKVSEDIVNEPIRAVFEALNSVKENYNIIICTGRDGICALETQQWLSDNKIRYDEFHIRPTGDQRKDYIVKEEMWRDISKRYNIVAMLDDRLTVINHARSLGFCVLDVAGNTF